MPTTRPSFAPTPLRDASALHHGKHYTCAIVTGGAVMCWGLNNRGQLGVGTTIGTDMPAPVLFP